MSARPTPAERRVQALADIMAGQPAERHLPQDVQAQMAAVLRYLDMTLADLETSRRKGYLARAAAAVRQLQTVLVLPDASAEAAQVPTAGLGPRAPASAIGE